MASRVADDHETQDIKSDFSRQGVAAMPLGLLNVIDNEGSCSWPWMVTKGDLSKHVLGNTILAQLTTRYPTPTASLSGRTCIVTVRDPAKGAEAREAILQGAPVYRGVLEVWELDMAVFATVAQFARRAEAELDRLDGECGRGDEWVAHDGGWVGDDVTDLCAIYGTAVLLLYKAAHLPLLPDTDKDTDHIVSHLTITGSGGQNVAKFIERSETNILDALNDETKLNSFDRYATSKLFNYFIAKKTAALSQASDELIPAHAWPASKSALNILYGLLASTPSGAYISRTRMPACVLPTAKWLDTAHEEGVLKRVWAEMVAVWEKAVPEVRRILDDV
ncbi:hypothetical protein C8R43DRAFT_1193350 [Mycena crocata]|nr:hypothetical protein C8R43DRAFT_1193350 [Mycena crocata]